HPDRRPVLVYRRRISPLLHVVQHVNHNLALSLCQSLTHAASPPTPARLPASQRPGYNTRSSVMQTHVRPSVGSFALPIRCVELGPWCPSQLLEKTPAVDGDDLTGEEGGGGGDGYGDVGDVFWVADAFCGQPLRDPRVFPFPPQVPAGFDEPWGDRVHRDLRRQRPGERAGHRVDRALAR